MSIVCPICHSSACKCDWTICQCWLSETEIRANLTQELQTATKEKQQQIIEQTKIAIAIKEDETTCTYDKHWAWGKCIYCSNYKRYEKYYQDGQCPVRISLKKLKENV